MELADGSLAVSIARRTIERGLAGDVDGADPARWVPPGPMPPSFEERRGAFVTLTQFPSDELRGCVGVPRPVLPLREAVPRAAWSAATEDPRFPPLDPSELSMTLVEVSILTAPVLLAPRDSRELPSEIEVGRDGLIVDRAGAGGLFLPQVAPEQGWDARRLLEETARKAGLPPNAWLDPSTRVQRFSAEIFRECEPRGRVVPRPLARTGPPEG